MTPNELPTSIEELQKLVMSRHQRVQSILTEKENLHREVIIAKREVDHIKREVIIAKQQAIELTSTVEVQKKRLEQSERTIKEVACWAHARRYWHKAREEDPARAHHVLAIVARRYKVEDAAQEKSAAARQSLRANRCAKSTHAHC